MKTKKEILDLIKENNRVIEEGFALLAGEDKTAPSSTFPFFEFETEKQPDSVQNFAEKTNALLLLASLVEHDKAQDMREGVEHCVELQRAIDFLEDYEKRSELARHRVSNMQSKRAFLWVFQDNRHGYQFWDSYLHPECDLIKTQKENPFK